MPKTKDVSTAEFPGTWRGTAQPLDFAIEMLSSATTAADEDI